MNKRRDAWVAQSVKHLILDCGSGHDLAFCGIKSHVGHCTDSAETPWDSFCPPSPVHALLLS